VGVEALVVHLMSRVSEAHARQQTGEFLFAVDHCFPIKVGGGGCSMRWVTLARGTRCT